jgi:hypothetical protein
MNNRVLGYGILILFIGFLVIWTVTGHIDSPLTGEGFGLWISALMSIFILSFLYDDNPFYKFAESLFIGVSAAYAAILGVWEQLVKNLLTVLIPDLAAKLVEGFDPSTVDTTGRVVGVLSLIFGLMLLMRLSPKGSWLARWPLALIVGWTAGTNLVLYLQSDFINQIKPTLVPMLVVGESAEIMWMSSFSNTVLVFGVLVVLIYFFFSVEHKGFFGGASKGGIWVLMLTFGAAFGYTVMGRIALLVGRMEFLFDDWLHLLPLDKYFGG